MSDNIPLDIQKEIMKRLPVKSLIQFRSVSKPWKTFIDSPGFIAGHHTQIHRFLLSYQNALNGEHHYLSFLDDNNFYFVSTVPVLPKPLLEHIIIGSSCGLICLWGDYRDERDSLLKKRAVIWNPSIRKSVAVDVPNVGCQTVVGFGVCPVTNDPTLVKITYGKFKNMSSISFPTWQVEVYTLSSKSWMRLISTNLPRRSIRVTWSQVVLGGFMYWLGFDRIPSTTGGKFTTCNLIISFDMTSQEFKVVGLPDSLSHQNNTLCISRLRESLVLLQYDVNNTGYQVWAVWVMEHAAPNSFTNLYTIMTPNASIKTVLGFTKTDAAIVGIEHDNYLMSDEIFAYELDSENKREVGICGASGSFVMNTYTETLLLLDQSVKE